MTSTGLLTRLKVFDLTRVLAGPTCVQKLEILEIGFGFIEMRHATGVPMKLIASRCGFFGNAGG